LQISLQEPQALVKAPGDLREQVGDFQQRYLPKFYRVQQRHNAATVIRGLLSGPECTTREPIATGTALPRQPIQFIVGAGKWDDEAVMGAALRSVRPEDILGWFRLCGWYGGLGLKVS
jgi:hypothetical protein